METIKIQKHCVKSIERYQNDTGFIIELENWVNPKTLLMDIKANSDIDIKDNIQIQYRMDSDNEIHITLYATDIDRVNFF